MPPPSGPHTRQDSLGRREGRQDVQLQQLAKKRLVPEAGEVPGYRPPVAPV